jgi:hypothetical protein
MLGHTGQTSTQIVILTKPQSYMVLPLGESDHPDSSHYDDQAKAIQLGAQVDLLESQGTGEARHGKKHVCEAALTVAAQIGYSSTQGR